MKFKGGIWTDELVEEWLPLWAVLWNEHGVRWEWQAGDEYKDYTSLRRGRIVSSAATILRNCPAPLPSWSVIQDMAEFIYSKENQDLYNRLQEFSYNLVPPNEVY